ncbi:anaerobic sulfatase maturase [Psychromonas sp. CD1]|uniref:anaerobic sulfatase maturase n=1 Tax=Psychromonas sp. CD1 TaxID=1979839 RepID=UPI001C5D3450|nr:anaerobic sulfatase maturase [Psychromonas sp. CD1]
MSTYINMHITAKPTSFQCNLNCDYCFYLEKEFSLPAKLTQTMTYPVLEQYIKHYIEAAGENVYFTWQGGEPTLAGLPFYEQAVKYQKTYAKNKKIYNAFQTNGILINVKWCDFFLKNDFLVGISIDGPETIHNKYRVTKSNKGTFKQVMRAIELFNEHAVKFNTLTVVNNLNVQYPIETYNFLKSIGAKHLQFIELVETQELNENHIPIWFGDEPQSVTLCPFSVPAEQYGKFMVEIFKQWVSQDVGKIFVRQFESLISCFMGNGHSSCIFQNACGDNLVIEADGSIYECDHFVYDGYLLGNISDIKLSNAFGHNVNTQKKTLSEQCEQCAYIEICNGGCPKHRFIKSKIDNLNVSYFCAGYKLMFREMTPYLNAMRELLNSGLPAYHIMDLVDIIRENQGAKITF